MAASTLEGDNVVNSAGNKLGQIKEIMIDVPTGRVAYAVLSIGGFLGIAEKLIAIPWQALRIDPPNHRFVLNVSKEQIERRKVSTRTAGPRWQKSSGPPRCITTTARNTTGVKPEGGRRREQPPEVGMGTCNIDLLNAA